MAVLLALMSAAAFGAIDFVSAGLSRRTSPWKVGFVIQAATAACLLPLALVTGGTASARDHLLGITAGVFAGIGTGLFFRGLAHGRIGVVAPVAAVGTAFIPVTLSMLWGQHPSATALLGVGIAFPAIWLVSSSSGNATERGAASGLLDGLLAGAAFGAVYACIARLSPSAGVLPVVDIQLVGAAVLGIVATLARQAWVPRDRLSWQAAWLGPAAALATIAFQTATQRGYLAVVAVVGSLYPAPTVLLAASVLGERIHRRQAVGLGIAAVAVSLVALG